MTETLNQLTAILAERRNADPSESYVASLHKDGMDRILQKVGEEATEAIIAAKSGDRQQIVSETADLWFHTMVMLDHCGASAQDVLAELERRLGVSGLDEKASRG